MTGKTKKIILISVSGIILTAAVVGYKMYNKKHFSVENAPAVAEISAADLHNTFVTDSTGAKNKFIGDEVNQKVIKVSGEISNVSKDQMNHVVVKLKTETIAKPSENSSAELYLGCITISSNCASL